MVVIDFKRNCHIDEYIPRLGASPRRRGRTYCKSLEGVPFWARAISPSAFSQNAQQIRVTPTHPHSSFIMHGREEYGIHEC